MRLKVESTDWARNKTMVLNQLASWGYPVDLMRTEGLTLAGFHETVLDANGNRQIDPATNRLLATPRLWNDPLHWEWLLENAPLELEEWELAVDEEIL